MNPLPRWRTSIVHEHVIQILFTTNKIEDLASDDCLWEFFQRTPEASQKMPDRKPYYMPLMLHSLNIDSKIPVENILNCAESIQVILGNFGMGKTTGLLRVMFEAIANDSHLPIWLSPLPTHGPLLDNYEWLCRSLHPTNLEELPEERKQKVKERKQKVKELNQWVYDGRPFLLLCDLGEFNLPKLQKDACQRIHELSESGRFKIVLAYEGENLGWLQQNLPKRTGFWKMEPLTFLQDRIRTKIIGTHKGQFLRYAKAIEADMEKKIGRIYTPLRVVSTDRIPLYVRPYQRSHPTPTTAPEDIFSAMANQRALLLLGNPGTGKTTALQSFAWNQASKLGKELTDGGTSPLQPFLVPIIIDMRKFNAAQKFELRQLIATSLSSASLTEDGIEQCCKSGLFHFLFDAVDGIPQVDYESGVDQIVTFIKQYPQNSYVVASRKHNCSKKFDDGLEIVEIQELNDKDIENFLEKRMDAEKSKRLYNILYARTLNKNVLELARNPLFLALMAEIYKNTERIPSSRGDLFESFINEVFASQKSEYKKIALSTKKTLLSRLASYMIDNGKGTKIEEGEARKVMGERLGELINSHEVSSQEDATTILDEIKANGVLQPVSPSEVEFWHQSVQEYLAVCEFDAFVAKQESQLKALWLEKFVRLAWDDPFVLYVGFCAFQPLIKYILKTLVEVDMRLLVRCFLAAEYVDKTTEDMLYLILQQKALDKNIPFIMRAKAIETLEALGKEDAARAILELLGDPGLEIEMKSIALKKLLQCVKRYPAMFPDCKSHLCREDSVVLWKDLLDDMTEIAKPEFGLREQLASLLKDLVKKTDAAIRGSALGVLSQIASKEEIVAVAHSLLNDTSAEVQKDALGILLRLQAYDTIEPHLLPMLNSNNKVLIEAAMTALQEVAKVGKIVWKNG